MMNVIKIITWFYKAKYLSILLFSLLLPSLVFSSTFNVTTTQEFRAALANSAGNGESDTINLAAGTYKTTDDSLGTFTFLDNEDFDLTIEGVSADTSILSGDDQNRVLSFNVVGSTAEIVFEKVSVLNGLTTTNGGGVYSKENFTCKHCIFRNNEAPNGGGLYVERENHAIIENSSFTDNKANYGGAIQFGYLVNPVIRNSTFISNQASSGGAIYLSSGYGTEIKNSMFRANSARSGGAIYQSFGGATVIKSSIFADNIASLTAAALSFTDSPYQRLLIANSIFYGNLVNETDGVNYSEEREVIRIFGQYGYIEIVNTAIINNSGGIRFSGDDEHTSISNTVFSNNSYSDVTIKDSTIPKIMNSFVPSITGTAFTENILTEGDLGFLDIANNDFHLSSNSVLIDSGVNIFTMGGAGWEQPNEVDIDSNQRLSGGSMDIGPYEFSTTRPTITKFDVEGVRKVDQVLSFVTDAAPSPSRIIASYEIDNGSGTFVSASSEFSTTYTTSGQRTVRVKVTDDQGEWTIKTLVISILDLTLDEKIVAATEAGRQEVINSPSTYGLALASEIPVAREAGRQDVISSPSTYDLALASEVPAAREEQIAACLASPSSCGINIPNADIDGNGTQDALTDGLLILRYSFGLTGDSLISGVVAADATRKTAEEIEAYLETLMP